jgi:hypothetical protein
MYNRNFGPDRPQMYNRNIGPNGQQMYYRNFGPETQEPFRCDICPNMEVCNHGFQTYRIPGVDEFGG